MLQDILRAKGLVLEGEEFADLPAGNTQIDEQALGQEIEEIHANADEIITADEAVTSLESLVATLESCGGAKTALEKHLAVSQAALLYKTMGLAAPVVPSLESADSVVFSLESWKETAKKVGDAIKAAWDKLVAMLKDLWAKLGDTAGKMHKKLSAKLKETTKTEVSFTGSMPVPARITEINDGNINDAFTDTDVEFHLHKANEDYEKLAKAMTDMSGNGAAEIVRIASTYSGERAREMTKELPFKLTVSKAGPIFLSQLAQISKWHRDWAGKNARKEASIDKVARAYVGDDADESALALYRKSAAAMTKVYAHEEKIMTNWSRQQLSLCNAFMAAL